jgi:transcriptional regulator with XRE-family HTH domain
VTAAATLRTARRRAGLTLRELARRAGTSHATLAAYEAGRKVPTVETFERVLRAAGFAATVDLGPAIGGPDRQGRGRELLEVLRLAERFPARHAATLSFPRFGAP